MTPHRLCIMQNKRSMSVNLFLALTNPKCAPYISTRQKKTSHISEVSSTYRGMQRRGKTFSTTPCGQINQRMVQLEALIAKMFRRKKQRRECQHCVGNFIQDATYSIKLGHVPGRTTLHFLCMSCTTFIATQRYNRMYYILRKQGEKHLLRWEVTPPPHPHSSHSSHSSRFDTPYCVHVETREFNVKLFRFHQVQKSTRPRGQIQNTRERNIANQSLL